MAGADGPAGEPAEGVESAEKLPRGMRKEVLTPAEAGELERPPPGAECTVHYVGRFAADGEEFDSSRARSDPLDFKLGVGQVIKAWDLAVATMRRGEVARFTCAPEYCYGERGSPPKIPGSATLVFEVELLDWRSEDDLFGDGGVVRTRLKEGTGFEEELQVGAEVLCSVTASDAHGRILDDRPKMDYVVGSGALGPLSRAVNRALEDMKRGEAVSLRCSKAYAYNDDSHGDVIVELTLHEVFNTQDVSPDKDKSILKRQTAEGDGHQKPVDGGQVHLTVEAATDAAGAAVAGFPGQTELQFRAGDGEVCDALEFAVVEMLKGERASIVCSNPAACAEPRLGLEGLAGTEGGGRGKVSLTVELKDFDNGRPIWDMQWEEKVAYFTERKEAGGKLFKAQRYRLALERYKQVIDMLRGYAEVPEFAEELGRVCELNKAACMQKLNDHFGVKAACSTVLAGDPRNVKALFRRASAYLALHEFSEAAADFRCLLEVDPDNKDAQRLLPHAVRGAKQEEKKRASTFARMAKAFSGFGDEEERRVQEAKEARENEIARKGAAAKAEAKKWKETRGAGQTKEEAMDDLRRASDSIAEMQRKCQEKSLERQFGKPEDD